MRRLPLLLPLLLLGMALARPEPPAPSGAQCLEHECFAAFWGPRSFAEASAGCHLGGGHLMTVRSTVAEEVIALLLQNRGGRLWLGLSLPASRPCSEPALQLRGYRWITGDSHTDYTNWAPSGPLCGELCVTVSRELRWEERRCEEPADGFLCEYSYGGSCPRLPPAEGLPVTYATPFGARGAEFLALPPRSVALVPALGLELRCDDDGEGGGLRWGRATPGAWPCRLGGGGCDGTCGEEDAGRPRCSCPDGSVLGPDGRRCRSPCAGAPCEHHCVVAGSSFVCMCATGYQLGANGSSCEDIDDCASEPGLCEQLCVNTMGGFECRCHSGYRMQNGRCQPVSPCDQAPCQQRCEDVPGGYRCGCDEGFAVDPQDATKCRLHCNDTQCPALCGDYGDSCLCPDGFVLDEGDRLCVDFDECDMNYCEHNCTNYPGSYKCHCPAGYSLVNDVECQILEEDGEGNGSGDFESQTSAPRTPVPQTAVPSRTPPKAEGLHPGALVGITVGTLLTALALLALGYHLAKKHCRPPATMDYKCGGPHEKELGLQPVASGCAGSGQKL